MESNFPVIFFAAMLPARSKGYPRLAKRSRTEGRLALETGWFLLEIGQA
jgi:hypothetical protein